MTAWRKSSYSDAHGNNCVEVAGLNQAVGVRDSKNPTGPHLSISPHVFGGLVDEIKAGKLDR